MPIPILLGLAAAGSAAYGTKKAFDARTTQRRATDKCEDAEQLIADAGSKLEQERERTQKSLKRLGIKKMQASESSLIPFKLAFEKIKNIESHEATISDEFAGDVDWHSEFARIEHSAQIAQDLLKGTLASIGTGGLLGIATYGCVGMVGTASTGTAISTLTGAAASNATLAWLGGGSLASGGFGMSAGAAILGGFVTGPMIAVGGVFMNRRADQAYRTAREYYAQAEVEAEKFMSAAQKAAGLRTRAAELGLVITSLQKRFLPLLEDLQRLVDKHERDGKVDYAELAERERQSIRRVFLYAQALRKLIDAKLIDAEGNYTEEAPRLIESARGEYFGRSHAA